MGLGLAMGAFLKCLFNREFASEVKGLALSRKGKQPKVAPEISEPKGYKKAELASEATAVASPAPVEDIYPWGAVHVLAEMQKEGRLIDFLEEDLSEYEDDEIGSSVRTIHEGCKRALEKICQREKVIDQEEESSVSKSKSQSVSVTEFCSVWLFNPEHRVVLSER